MKLMFLATAAILSVGVAGCTTTKMPTTQKEVFLNRAAGAEVAAANCASAGGYSSVAQMRSDQQTNLTKARQLGATDAEYTQARTRVQGQFNTAYIFTNAYMACNNLINTVAWAGTETPNLPATAPAAPATAPKP